MPPGVDRIKFYKKLTYTQLIALSFVGIILLGGLLLCLPAATRARVPTPPINAFFTAVSATCVTGLVVYDTFLYWSVFGQLVILMMIQIGGLGFMSVMTLFSFFLKRQIGLHERRLLMQSAGTMRLGGVVRLMQQVLRGTLLCETAGAALLSIRFCRDMGFGPGLYAAVFHSVSAFCNAGFDLMGRFGPFSSLMRYAGDPLVSVTIMALIIVGGIGFLVWSDVLRLRFRFFKMNLHTRLALASTAVLLAGGTALFAVFEWNGALSGMPVGEKLLAAAFQSVTPRTAGFNTIDLTRLSEGSKLLTMILMFIGGSPGSTAGGIKTTTAVVLVMGALAAARHSSGITVGKRRLDDDIAKQASAILITYLAGIFTAILIICAADPFSLTEVAFEAVSAAGTVGLTLGITPLLSPISKASLMFLMYGGRVGGLSLALVLAEKRSAVPVSYPVEKIMIG